MARKGKNSKRKNKKSLTPEEEKKEMVSVLMVKCDKTEEEVLQAYDDFHINHTDGVISKDDFLKSTDVTGIIIIYSFHLIIYFDRTV